MTGDIQRALALENIIQNIIDGKYGSGPGWRDSVVNDILSLGIAVWTLTPENNSMFSQAYYDLAYVSANGTKEQVAKVLEDIKAGKYGGSAATGGSSGSGGSGGSGSGSWTGSYTQTGYNTWTDGNGNTTHVDPLSGIDWGRGVEPPNIFGGSGQSDYTTSYGGGGSHY